MARAADYYALLGVERGADHETIKRAFRERAREVHPDVSDEPEAAERFQELARAYRVLTAPTARLLYDRFGYRGAGNGGFEGDVDVVGEVVLAPLRAKRGARRTVWVSRLETCAACAGVGAAAGDTRECPTCRGSGVAKRAGEASFGRLLQFDDCADCGGSGRVGGVCPKCGGEGRIGLERELEVVVPPRTRDGDLIAVADGEAVHARVTLFFDEPRVVRYGAVAALAVAIAFLVFLLFFS